MNEQELEIWKEGYRAYQDDIPIRDNPYSPDQDEWDFWKEGYYQAAEDD